MPSLKLSKTKVLIVLDLSKTKVLTLHAFFLANLDSSGEAAKNRPIADPARNGHRIVSDRMRASVRALMKRSDQPLRVAFLPDRFFSRLRRRARAPFQRSPRPRAADRRSEPIITTNRILPTLADIGNPPALSKSRESSSSVPRHFQFRKSSI